MDARKKILVLNGSFCEKPIIEKAKEMGYHVTTTGNAPNLIGHRSADEYVYCDYSDKEAVLRLVKEHDIEGIVSCANDFGVLTAAYVAEKMGWEGHDSYQTAKLLHHKDEFKRYCREKGIPSPLSVSFDSPEEAGRYCETCEYPVIVKANDLTGGKGIRKAENLGEALPAIENAFSMSRDKRVLVEPFLEGRQSTIVVFLVDGQIAVTSGCDCYSQKNPYLIQAETYPPVQFEEALSKLHGIIRQIAEDLGLADGILALQYINCGGEPYVIEAMRRCFGNEALLLSDMITGFPWEEAYVRASLGLDCSGMKASDPPMKFCGHFGVMADQNGVLKGLEIPPEIESHLFKKTVMVRPGGRISNHMEERIAYLYYSYDGLEEMNREVPRFNDLIKVEMEGDSGAPA